jgi:hypothetical protein
MLSQLVVHVFVIVERSPKVLIVPCQAVISFAKVYRRVDMPPQKPICKHSIRCSRVGDAVIIREMILEPSVLRSSG